MGVIVPVGHGKAVFWESVAGRHILSKQGSEEKHSRFLVCRWSTVAVIYIISIYMWILILNLQQISSKRSQHILISSWRMQNNLVDISRAKWDSFSHDYASVDSGPQTFYFTLVNLLVNSRSKNILEIGAGAGLLLSYTISKKLPLAHYLATDLSPQMIELARKRLLIELQKNKSTLTLQNWLIQNNVQLRAENGMQIIPATHRFDTVICNLVLNLVPQPRKMLRSIHAQTTADSRVGITIWGQKSKDRFLTFSQKAMLALGLPLPSPQTSPFRLNTVLKEYLLECGWQILIDWEQEVAYPFTDATDEQSFLEFQSVRYPHLSLQQQNMLLSKIKQLYKEWLEAGKAFIMSCRMCIIKKLE